MFGKYKEKNCAPPRKNIHVVSLQFDNQIGGQKDTCGTPMGQEKILSSAFFFFFFLFVGGSATPANGPRA
jgi:hypothetical protein